MLSLTKAKAEVAGPNNTNCGNRAGSRKPMVTIGWAVLGLASCHIGYIAGTSG